VRRDHNRSGQQMKAIEREYQAHAGLSRAAVLNFDLAKIVRSQEETASAWCMDVHQIALPQARHRPEFRVLLENEAHFAVQAAAEALSAAAQRRALRTNVVEHTIGKSEKQWKRLLRIHRLKYTRLEVLT